MEILDTLIELNIDPIKFWYAKLLNILLSFILIFPLESTPKTPLDKAKLLVIIQRDQLRPLSDSILNKEAVTAELFINSVS